MSERLLTLGEVADHFRVYVWQVQRLYERKLLAPPPRVGNRRVVPESGLAVVKAALVRGGYLK